MDNKLCFNVSEAAQSLGVSRPKMYDLMKIEGFPVLRVGKRVLIPIDGLKRWIEEQAGGCD